MSSASFCGHCGNQINAGYLFCSKCGKSLNGEPLTPQSDISTPKGKFLTKKSYIVFAIVALIAFFILSLPAWDSESTSVPGSVPESVPQTELYYDPAEVIRYQECLDNGQGAFGGGAGWDKFTCRSYEPKLKIRNKQ